MSKTATRNRPNHTTLFDVILRLPLQCQNLWHHPSLRHHRHHLARWRGVPSISASHAWRRRLSTSGEKDGPRRRRATLFLEAVSRARKPKLPASIPSSRSGVLSLALCFSECCLRSTTAWTKMMKMVRKMQKRSQISTSLKYEVFGREAKLCKRICIY